ncbi:sigma-54 dependent transcriptional regulator [uncultured Alistipes sp.]|uniref:sigma-54-dependent transcriptional regulator n=1 Tax=uncultured Alistipes sp. TaxID=538949 RepID=UPI00262DCC53|nr:sigma-54 dependent transcriptional regulator [uncultured Alistipes sp.]
MTNVLVVDGERSIRNTLKERLEYEGYRVETAETGTEAADKTSRSKFDVVLCDMAVPETGAIGLLNVLNENGKFTPFIMLSALKGLDPAIDSIRHGAFDYIPKPIDLNKLLGSIRSAVEGNSQNRATIEKTVPDTPRTRTADAASARPAARRKSSGGACEIVGESKSISHVKNLIAKIAPSDARVLITGSNGTGKELVAHQLHMQSARADRPFVEVNCAAIPSELIESELFGHEKGAFTSAIKQRKGKFEQADGGTLFLDEIGDMSLSAQAKVLRALQENRISRVGSDKDIDVNVRVVAATNKDLKKEIAAGNFREDLYHRLSVIVVRVPSLSERLEDIPLLARHFIEKISAEYGQKPKPIDEAALAELGRMEWSGNVREFRNVIERLIILSGKSITLDDVETYAVAAAL